MQKIAAQCTSCGAFARRSLHHEEEYQSSVFLERLRTTNFPATDEEISHVRHTILPTVFDDISSIDSKVASLQEVIRSMEEERERLNNVQKRYNNLVSLNRTLPVEIWSKIFLYTRSSVSDYNAFDASGSIWQLSHVCQRWRNVALSLQSFWSTMDIDFPKAAQHEGDVQCLETVIQRSRQGLLDISLSDAISDSHGRDSNPSILKRLLDIALAESYRWRLFHVLEWQGDLNMLFAPLHNRLPRLESIGFYSGVRLRLDENPMMSIFRDCPRLTKLTLGILGLEFPWDQITELDLSSMDLDGDEEERRACMRLIGQCPSLEVLSTPDSRDDEDELVYAPITCSNVRKLEATSVPVIDALTLPRLREASLLRNPNTAHYDMLGPFKELFIRSSCLSTLTGLSLAMLPLAPSSKHSLLSILSETHSLTFLDLAVSMQEFSPVTAVNDQGQIVALVDSLAVVPTETVTFLPLLSSLFIRVYKHHDKLQLSYFGSVGSLASMLKARWELGRLKTCLFTVQALHLKCENVYRGTGRVAGIFDEAESLVFTALVDDGMDLAIRVTSDLTDNVGSSNVVFAVPS